MNSEDVLGAWQKLLPPNISVSAGPILDYPSPLSLQECEFAGELSARRMQEFASGRTYAKRALALLGVTDANLPIGSDRSPIWPCGFVGSITHVPGWVDTHIAAAVGRTEDFYGIGIDVEHDEFLHPALWSYMFTASEHDHLLGFPPHRRASQAQAIWCAKEAVIKAARRIIEPTILEVEFSNGDFTAFSDPPSFHSTRSSELPTREWRGRVARAGRFILAAAFEHAGSSAPIEVGSLT